ncbi:hypothetical protein [Sphingobacterium paludis]|uniref:Outer membrane protein with beta-barrel domain n=1 Tax=Sphingobacterium paludis TaxID=1476465 RepID=A0A4R7DB88_9SPHI|nr:hypothetical protein [Sphingobacterium paludis]TDS17541.1 hypothetical protein B0I21_101408 [Sphingobacterium paludis]
MMRILISMLALYAAQPLFSQEQQQDTIATNAYTERFESVAVEGGVTIPLGSLHNVMNTAPNVAFWIRQKRSESTVFNYGASVNFPAQRRFPYAGTDETARTRSFSGFVGIQADKILSISSRSLIDVEWGTSGGYAFYFYDDLRARREYASNPKRAKDKDEAPTFVKPLSSFFIGQSLKLRIGEFGLHARYNFTPYSLFNDIVDRSFGAHSVTVGLFYRQ